MRQTPTVLHVEDNPHDHHLLALAFEELDPNVTIERAENAAACFATLDALGDELPALVVIDLNLPVVSGHRIVRHLRLDERWRRIPIAVLTSSRLPRDIEEARRLGADAYFVKPFHYDGFLDLARLLTWQVRGQSDWRWATSPRNLLADCTPNDRAAA